MNAKIYRLSNGYVQIEACGHVVEFEDENDAWEFLFLWMDKEARRS